MSLQMIGFLGSTLLSGAAVPQTVSAANPLPVALAGAIGALAVAGVQPAGVLATANPVIVSGIDGTGTIRDFLTDGSGVLQVNATLAGGGVVGQGAGNTANPWTVQGASAVNTAEAGNPVPAGARVAVSTVPTYTDANRGSLQVDANGFLWARAAGTSTNFSDGTSNTGVRLPSAVNGGGLLEIAPFTFNGATWDRMRSPAGDAVAASGLQASPGMVFNGSTWDRNTKGGAPFKLPSSAATNNAANVKASAGAVHGVSAFNTQATTRYLKLFNTNGAPNPAVLAQFDLIALPTGQTVVNFGPLGEYFSTGIGFAIVANPADLDNTAVAAGDIVACVVRFA